MIHPREIIHAAREESRPTAKKSAASAKAAVQATVTLKQLAKTLSDSHHLPTKHAEAVLGDFGGARHPAPQEG